jgi:hypothetical protein
MAAVQRMAAEWVRLAAKVLPGRKDLQNNPSRQEGLTKQSFPAGRTYKTILPGRKDLPKSCQ